MFFKKIKIVNYGCIDLFDYTFRQDTNGNPIPLVLIGKNGSGKSLVVANLVDSIIEFKKKAYPSGVSEVVENNYFKIGSKSYIKYGKNESIVALEAEANGTLFKYFDIMSKNQDESLKNNKEIKEAIGLIGDSRFKKAGFGKNVLGEIDSKTFEENEFIYFPVDRYSIPTWFNDRNYSKVNYDEQGYVGKSNKNIIKIDVLRNIKNWLYKVFLHQVALIVKNGLEVIPDSLQNTLNQILEAIKGPGTRFAFCNRKFDSVQIVLSNGSIVDISNLSSGEMMSLAMFVSIIKDYDADHNISNLAEISGVCIIDEIDLNLHIKQQMEVLPRLIKMFPKMQFIITTHSPFFAKGMSDAFGVAVDFVEMPSGRIINRLADFSEIKESIKAFEEDTADIINKLDLLESEYNNLKRSGDILVLTEGKTDCKYIKKAFEKLGRDMSGLSFLGLGDEHSYSSGDKDLDKLLHYESMFDTASKKIIAIFDNDNPDITRQYPCGQLKEIVPGRIYAFCIPVPNKRNGESNISIEHYFANNELRTSDTDGHRLYQVEEFYETGVLKSDSKKTCPYLALNYCKHSGNYVLSGSDNKKVYNLEKTTNYSLSKNDFCENVINDITGFDSFDFSDFSLIIDLIDEAKNKING